MPNDEAPAFPLLEEQCPECHGKRFVHYETAGSGTEIGHCGKCNGKGTVTTAFGKAVLDFIRDRLRIDGALIQEGD